MSHVRSRSSIRRPLTHQADGHTPEPRRRNPFTLIKVSAEFHELLNAVCNAATALGHSTTTEDINRAYSHLNLAREELAKYAERIETRARVERGVSLRF